MAEHQHSGAREEETAGSIVGSFLCTSATTVAETVADLAGEMDQAFAPLPTDVQHVDLQVSVYKTQTKAGYKEEVHLDVVIGRRVP
eukprot:CAMPEP_0183741418 /NCGR_PEP_ID=MMETSP0737-20130205/62099_1 /TAXON_ID=385413 /ORGANISM="Thalassiosira miniscula, Strain CCMP1093" /LENGTH=85 /DNA_ID=CAMNT_0025976745 /DNA_START=30 /DNA_END=284 /DNA_ORIENTATION=-